MSKSTKIHQKNFCSNYFRVKPYNDPTTTTSYVKKNRTFLLTNWYQYHIW